MHTVMQTGGYCCTLYAIGGARGGHGSGWRDALTAQIESLQLRQRAQRLSQGLCSLIDNLIACLESRQSQPPKPTAINEGATQDGAHKGEEVVTTARTACVCAWVALTSKVQHRQQSQLGQLWSQGLCPLSTKPIACLDVSHRCAGVKTQHMTWSQDNPSVGSSKRGWSVCCACGKYLTTVHLSSSASSVASTWPTQVPRPWLPQRQHNSLLVEAQSQRHTCTRPHITGGTGQARKQGQTSVKHDQPM